MHAHVPGRELGFICNGGDLRRSVRLTHTHARTSLVTECNARLRAIFLQTATKFHCVYFILADLGGRSKWLFMRTTEGCCDVDYLSFCLSFWLNRI